MTDPDTLAVGFRGDPGDVAEQAWAVPGPSTYVTTHEPLAKWPHVWAGGTPQTLGKDFEQSGRTLTVLADMELETGQALVCRYDYLEGPVSFVQPADPVPVELTYFSGNGGNILYAIQNWPGESGTPGETEIGDVMIAVTFHAPNNPTGGTGPELVARTPDVGSGWQMSLYKYVYDEGSLNLVGSGGGFMWAVFRGVSPVIEYSHSISAGNVAALGAAALNSPHDVVIRFWAHTGGGTAIDPPTSGEVVFSGAVGGDRFGLMLTQSSPTAVGELDATDGSAKWASFTVGLDNV